MKLLRSWRFGATSLLVAFWATAAFGAVQQEHAPTPASQEGAAQPPTEPTGSQNGAATEKAAAKTPPEIAGWIADLDVRQYRVREKATRQLLTAGPSAFDPLLATANSDRPEPADRAVWLLQQYSNSGPLEVRRAALERLVQLKDRPQAAAAANEALALIRHRESRLAIEQLGGRFTNRLGVDLSLVIDDHWKGKSKDMALLRDIIELQHVVIIGRERPIEDMAQLQNVPTLEKVWLYGTRVEPDDLVALKKLMPQAEFDYRRGGLLGIKSRPIGLDGDARVEEVQPETAAAAAGIQKGDVIRRFNNQDVRDFKDLTEKIGKFRAGDEVSLDILRNGATMKITLKLGQWSTEQLLAQRDP